MADSKPKPAPEAGGTAFRVALGFRVVDLDPKASIYVPLTGRTYIPEAMDQDQLAQLFALGWSHVAQA